MARVHQFPGRLAAGGFILTSGMNKTGADEQTAAMLHGMTAEAYPFIKDMDPVRFTRLVSRGEIALGAALLVPVVPSLVAGAALTAFAGSLLGLYLKLPGMRKEGSLLPSDQGLSLAKDVWLLSIGLGLVVEELCGR